MYAHVFRRYAQAPAYLGDVVSRYYASHSGLHPDAPNAKMPADLARDVCAQQRLFTAHKFRMQYQLTIPENAATAWRQEVFPVGMRTQPLLGFSAAEDLLASVLVDGMFGSLGESGEKNLLMEDHVRGLANFVEESTRARASGNVGALLEKAKDAMKHAVPPLSEAEAAWQPQPLPSAAGSSTAVIDSDEIGRMDEGEGYPELDALPNESFTAGSAAAATSAAPSA
jgi:hypothetical protein